MVILFLIAVRGDGGNNSDKVERVGNIGEYRYYSITNSGKTFGNKTNLHSIFMSPIKISG